MENHNEIFANYSDIVTVDELQIMLNIGKSTAYKILREQIIPNRKICGKYIIPKINVIKYVFNEI